MLNVFEKDGNVCLKPKSFLGKDVFAGIAQRIKELGGNYSNGLFKIPLGPIGPSPELTPLEELHRMVMDFKNHTEKEFEKILRKIGDLKK